ncbi:hypothetical protein [Nitrosomonas sp.]|uniref:hypothetical protein n=1 Tax=Nitrosomonas sp. TaxID=42353 RepID=UPI0020828411|nr:hypothetical protein [Nitrosomonas sp.]GJL75564.1 MAG: hypothetical protein NMNS02_16700 [Nitrosomonas sp.]
MSPSKDKDKTNVSDQYEDFVAARAKDTTGHIIRKFFFFVMSAIFVSLTALAIFSANVALGEFPPNIFGITRNFAIAIFTVGVIFLCYVVAWILLNEIVPQWVSRQAKNWLYLEERLKAQVEILESENNRLNERLKDDKEIISELKSSIPILEAKNKKIFYEDRADKTLTPFFKSFAAISNPIKEIWIQATFLGVDEKTFNLISHFKSLISAWCDKQGTNYVFNTVTLITPNSEKSILNARNFAVEVLSHVADKRCHTYIEGNPIVKIVILPYDDVFPCLQIWGDEGLLVVPSVHHIHDTSETGVDSSLPVAFGGFLPELKRTCRRLKSYLSALSHKDNGNKQEQWMLPNLGTTKNNINLKCTNYIFNLTDSLDRRILSEDFTGVTFTKDDGSETGDLQISVTGQTANFNDNARKLFQGL